MPPENGENFTTHQGENITYVGNQPIENLSFYLNESQNLEIKRCVDGQETGVAYYLKRMYIEEIGWPGVGNRNPISSIALTFRDRGITPIKIYLIRMEDISDVEVSEKRVIEIETEDNCFIQKSRIIIFDENGENPQYWS